MAGYKGNGAVCGIRTGIHPTSNGDRLYSRRVIGWSMPSRQTADVVLQALLMTVWRRKPRAAGKFVAIHARAALLDSGLASGF
jgi:transposase InsO family protein